MSNNYEDSAFVPELSQVNAAIKKLARKDRGFAVAILAKYGAMNTAGLSREDFAAVLDHVDKALARFPADKPLDYGV